MCFLFKQKKLEWDWVLRDFRFIFKQLKPVAISCIFILSGREL